MTRLHISSRVVYRAGLSLFIAALVPCILAQEKTAPRTFDLPADTAEKSLKRFAAQSGVEVVFGSATAAQVRTNPVKGTYAPREAIERMITGTGLVVAADEKTGALTVSRPPNGQRAALAPSDRPTETKNDTRNAPQEAQNSAASVPGILQLSPFVVEAGADRGYAATDTLSGTRMKTPLEDVAAQLNVMTSQLFEDVAAGDLEEMMRYTSNTESFLEFNPSNNLSFGARDLSNSNTRIRGLEEVSKMRGLFQTLAPIDSYNTDRVTVASGPSSVLVGMGLAGGVVDAGLKRAEFKNRHRVAYRTDNFGTDRWELDVNRALKPNILAARLAALHDDRGGFRYPDRDMNKRLYAAVTFNPFKNTSIDLNKEWYTRNAARTTMILGRDFATPWLNVGSPAFDNSGGNAPTRAGQFSDVFIANNNVSPVYAYGNSAPMAVRPFSGTVNIKPPHQLLGVRPQDNFAHSFNRPDILPPLANVVGLTHPNRISGDVVILSIQQRLRDNLHLELAGAHERYDELRGGYSQYPVFGDGSFQIRADPNRFLPDRTTANPNFAKFYVEDRGALNEIYNRLDNVRLALAYSPDFTRFTDWRRWLGRQQLAASYLLQVTDNKDQTHASLIGDAANGRPPSIVTGAGITDYRANQRLLRTRYYLDRANDPNSRGRYYREVIGRDAQAALDFVDPVTGERFPVYLNGNPQGAFNTPAGTGRQNVQSLLLGLNSNLFKERIVLFNGLRRDEAKTAVLRDSDRVAKSNGMFKTLSEVSYTDYGPTVAKTSYNWGVVAKTTPWLAFHYSSSENFTPLSNRLDPYSRGVPGKSGTGRDYGVRLNLFGGRLSTRINLFENTQLSADAAAGLIGLGGVVNPIFTLEQRIRRDIARNTPVYGFDPLTRVAPDFQAVADLEARGLDLELVANPTPNWRIFMTAGRQRTLQSNTARIWLQYANERLPVWRSAGRGWDVETISDDPGAETIHQYYDRAYFAGVFTPILFTDGLQTNRQREWRFNVTTNYRFSHERLKGLSVGGGARYRAKSLIGNGLKTLDTSFTHMFPDGTRTILPANTLVNDLDRAFYSPSQIYLDASASYEFRPVKWGRLKIQLNVQNLLDEDALVAGQATSDGIARVFGFQLPRQVTLTTSFEF